MTNKIQPDHYNKTSALCLFFCLLLGTYCQAQVTYLSVFGMPQRTFINNRYENEHARLATMNVNNGERYIEKPATYTYGVGFLLKHPIQKRALFCYGLSYSNQAQNYKIARDSMNSDILSGRIRLSYVKLPLMIQYNYVQKENYSFFVCAGPQISMLFYERGGVPSYGRDFLSFDVMDAGGVYKNLTIDGVIGIGAEYRLTPKTCFFIRGIFDYSFNDVEKKSFEELYYTHVYKILDHVGIDRSATHNISIGLGVGCTFRIR